MDELTKALIETVNFAAIKHRHQQRKDGHTPYDQPSNRRGQDIDARSGNFDLTTIQAAILHDTVEDTDTTPEEIEEHFGSRVRAIVDEVTDDKRLPSEVRKRLQIEHAPHSSHEAKLVKLADKLYNLRDLSATIPLGWNEQRVQAYFEWSEKVVHGLRGTNKPMEQALDQVFEARRALNDKNPQNQSEQFS
uniref:Putative guanosine polyphosphate pyrophosphohydrolase/synthase n=1 Tax=Ixodes ricinus TaxID=34613 RepID=A0A0K8RGJ2_IXORI